MAWKGAGKSDVRPSAHIRNRNTSFPSMNTTKPFAFSRPILALAGVVAAAGLAVSVAAFAGQNDHPSVTVKVDEQPIARAVEGNASYAPVVKQVAPSVVKVLVTER